MEDRELQAGGGAGPVQLPDVQEPDAAGGPAVRRQEGRGRRQGEAEQGVHEVGGGGDAAGAGLPPQQPLLRHPLQVRARAQEAHRLLLAGRAQQPRRQGSQRPPGLQAGSLHSSSRARTLMTSCLSKKVLLLHRDHVRIEHEVSTGRRATSGPLIRVEQGRESSHFLQ